MKSGTLDDPIVVKSFGDEQYCGCTGCPADSHVVKWLTVRPSLSLSFPHTNRHTHIHTQSQSSQRPTPLQTLHVTISL